MPVIVTGTFILPDGDVAADRVITIRRANRGVVQQSGQVVLPDDVVIETDITGQVLFDLVPGNYVGFARTMGGLSASFTMAVPDVDTVDVAAVINADSVPDAFFPIGDAGQVVGYGQNGVLVAVNLPDGTLPPGTEGQIVGYGAGGVVVAVDASDGSGYDDTAIIGRVQALENEPAPSWGDVTGKPTTFPPAVHGHAIADVTGLRAELDAIPEAYDDTALSGRVSAVEADLEAIPGPYDDTALAGRVAEVETDVVTAQSRADAAYSLAQQGGGTGSYDDTELRGRIVTLENEPAPSWDDVTGKPSTFAPRSHSHSISDVTGLQVALDGKQPTTAFKTVNGEAITGTGNIAIPAGPPPPVVVQATAPTSPVAGTFYVVTG